jgi:hypothetical protein
MLHRIMMKINLHQRRPTEKSNDNKKVIPFIIPFYPSALTHTLKKLIHDLAERSECDYLRIRPVLAFKRTANILQLCGGSGITPNHQQTIAENTDSVARQNEIQQIPNTDMLYHLIDHEELQANHQQTS